MGVAGPNFHPECLGRRQDGQQRRAELWFDRSSRFHAGQRWRSRRRPRFWWRAWRRPRIRRRSWVWWWPRLQRRSWVCRRPGFSRHSRIPGRSRLSWRSGLPWRAGIPRGSGISWRTQVLRVSRSTALRISRSLLRIPLVVFRLPGVLSLLLYLSLQRILREELLLLSVGCGEPRETNRAWSGQREQELDSCFRTSLIS